jgi:hypothetical protein
MEVDIGKGIRQLHRFFLRAIIVDSLELGLLRNPIYDNSRVTKDVKVADRPAGSKIEGGP